MSSIFNVEKQLSFYGAYHSNSVNKLIHIIFVPLILWSASVFLVDAPVPSFVPYRVYQINGYLVAETNWALAVGLLYFSYYLTLEPVAALIYLPQLSLSVLSATSFAHYRSQQYAIAVHVASWIVQFLGHGLAEKRAPALLDNLLGAIVLAPFFVHLEILFALGYNPSLHKKVQNLVGIEITRIRTEEGRKKRA